SATAHISCISPFSSLLAPRHLSHFCIFSLTSPSDIYTLSLHDALPICQVINQDPYHYYTITESAEQELIKATNELHLMYLHATDKVLKEDNLLALFDTPKILWPRLRLSWQRRRPHMITGRMDFCMDERGLKAYEYHAHDS